METLNLLLYHQITDPANPNRYEVPVPLNLPSEAGTAPLYQVTPGAIGERMAINVVRASNGNILWVGHTPAGDIIIYSRMNVCRLCDSHRVLYMIVEWGCRFCRFNKLSFFGDCTFGYNYYRSPILILINTWDYEITWDSGRSVSK